ncbi:hypothetical protein CapIbe_008619 [Capra ibex]
MHQEAEAGDIPHKPGPKNKEPVTSRPGGLVVTFLSERLSPRGQFRQKHTESKTSWPLACLETERAACTTGHQGKAPAQSCMAGRF